MKKVLAMVLALVMIFSLVACAKTEQAAPAEQAATEAAPAAEGAKDGKFKIAICAMNADNSWMAKHLENIEKEIQNETDEFEYSLSVGKDAADQQGIVETYMAEDYDCIILMPMDSTLLKDVCDRVYDSGIPLIISERPIEGDKYLAYVGASDYDCGKLAADYIGEKLNGEGKVAVLRNFVGGECDALRYQGFVDGITAKFPKIEIIREADAENSREKGYTMMGDILAACDNIDAVYAQVDEAGLGALQAIENAGRDDVKVICGVGGCKEIFDLHKTDSIYSGTTTFLPYMGALAIQKAREYLKGGQIEKEIVDPAYLVTAENVDEFYDRAV